MQTDQGIYNSFDVYSLKIINADFGSFRSDDTCDEVEKTFPEAEMEVADEDDHTVFPDVTRMQGDLQSAQQEMGVVAAW